MRKNITQNINNEKEENKGEVVAPSEAVVNFLKLYARGFYIQQDVPEPFNRLMLN